MRYTFKLGSFFGIPVKIHITFPLILILFGAEAWIRGGVGEALWAVALVMAVFICVVLHELGHSLQVRRYGVPVRDIVLLPIGGMARAEKIPEDPWQEIVVAISGPMVNFSIATILLAVILIRGEPMDIENDFLTSLFSINIVLGAFNLIPAFPMDGGRILRGLLAVKMPYLRATHHAKNIGQAIAILFAVVGFVNSSLIMLPVIAVVIFFGAMSEESMTRMKIMLGGKPVREFLHPDTQPLLLSDPIDRALDRFEGSDLEALPVTDESGRLPGAVLREDLVSVAAKGGGQVPLANFVTTGFPLMEADAPALQVYSYLKGEQQPFAGLIENGLFIGLVPFAALSRAIA